MNEPTNKRTHGGTKQLLQAPNHSSVAPFAADICAEQSRSLRFVKPLVTLVVGHYLRSRLKNASFAQASVVAVAITINSQSSTFEMLKLDVPRDGKLLRVRNWSLFIQSPCFLVIIHSRAFLIRVFLRFAVQELTKQRHACRICVL